MSGSYDLLVLVEARTLKELAAFVSGKLSPLETVTGTATSFVLKRYKEEGVIFDNGETDRRLVISPYPEKKKNSAVNNMPMSLNREMGPLSYIP
jgi:hypothetical protein